MRLTTLALAAIWAGQAVLAAPDALVIGNGSSAWRLPFGEERVARTAEALRAVGFEVTDRTDATDGEMRAAFARFVAGLEPGDGPVVVVLAGSFLHSGTGAWFTAPTPRAEADAVRVMTAALPLDAVLTVLAQFPGRALLVLGEVEGTPDHAPWLAPGIGDLEIPQGVTVVHGPEADVMQFALREIPRPGVPVLAAAGRHELAVEGYAPAGHVILRQRDVQAPVEAAPQPDPDAEARRVAERLAQDEAAWALARAADNAAGYRQYLAGFPDGQNAAAARQRLAAIEAEPFYAERRAEEALELSRDARREIQRDLSLLGHDPRGIDGIFGRGTRSAIGSWQAANGMVKSGYLNPRQIALLDTQARQRAAELEAEARARQAELERRDQALWQEVERQGDEAGLRRYLQEFPDGLHADRARERLAEIERQREQTAAERDRAAWDEARARDTEASYARYLEARPDGAFAAQARARIAELRRAGEESRDVARARAEEQSLGLNPVARRLAEARLDQLGLKPGRVDGTFDGDTRKAIRRYQRDRGLPVTGFLDQETVVRLLADGILGR